MGYETKMMIVHSYDKKGGNYQEIEATLEMGRICYDAVAELIDKARAENNKKVRAYKKKTGKDLFEQIELIKEYHDVAFTARGDYNPDLTEKDVEKAVKRYFDHRGRIERVLPFVYDNHDEESFVDCYNDLLLIVSVKEAIEAFKKNNAIAVAKGDYETGYRRYDIAIKLLEAFQVDFGQEVRVVLFGH